MISIKTLVRSLKPPPPRVLSPTEEILASPAAEKLRAAGMTDDAILEAYRWVTQ